MPTTSRNRVAFFSSGGCDDAFILPATPLAYQRRLRREAGTALGQSHPTLLFAICDRASGDTPHMRLVHTVKRCSSASALEPKIFSARFAAFAGTCTTLSLSREAVIAVPVAKVTCLPFIVSRSAPNFGSFPLPNFTCMHRVTPVLVSTGTIVPSGRNMRVPVGAISNVTPMVLAV